MNITEIDKNLKVETNIEKAGLVFHNVRETPFKIYGIFHDGEKYRRIPDSVAENTSPGVRCLASNTAGGRVRFITDSPYVAIKAVLPHNVLFSHMPLAGVAGFDMYVYENGRYTAERTFVPPYDFENGYELLWDSRDGDKERFITINFPLYNDVYELYIGLKEGSVLKPAPEYSIQKPIVYYGSSITQGGCASRPGSCYQAIISRKYDADYINLGFSGNGKGEQIMADYIASLDMSMFVLDYDHNAPTNEHYEKTHENFYKTVRAAHPDVPIMIMTRPKSKRILLPFELERIEIARKTYQKAKDRGENVYFIPGYELADIEYDDGRVDEYHPSDLGFYFMAKRLSEEMDKIYSEK